jgi:hypothetical protein
MILSLVSAHAGRDTYPGTSLIQMLCANVWEVAPKIKAMFVMDEGFRRYSVIFVLQEGMAKC